MAAEWAWAVAGPGGVTLVATAVRSWAYVWRERARTRAVAAILRELGPRTGSVEVTDPGGEGSWTVRVEDGGRR